MQAILVMNGKLSVLKLVWDQAIQCAFVIAWKTHYPSIGTITSVLPNGVSTHNTVSSCGLVSPVSMHEMTGCLTPLKDSSSRCDMFFLGAPLLVHQ